ncbi:substrate-binding domain-containing protein [Lachnospiraceae bacterium ASD3451]|uniref:substrate-binding domain-containing protein n=1 Tax=Diplocloster agilis TaxID=2850323 RepID=UPI001D8EB376|nr:substrate-binding domain-containing protein [Diplocloster agilis]MBU9743664.1 substrate-binding domain-containing protein [Diplocloster agilis]
MKKYVGLLLAGILLGSVCLSGCGSGETDKEALPAAEDDKGMQDAKDTGETDQAGDAKEAKADSAQLLIGIACYSADEYQKSWLDTFEAAAESKGNIKVVSTNADANVEKQVSDVESLIAQNPDVIILRAVDADGLAASVDACVSAGIPVVASSYEVHNDKISAWVGANQKDNGIIQGEYLQGILDANPDMKMNLCYIWGGFGLTGTQERYDGLNDPFVNKLKADGRGELLAEKAGNWSASDAMALTEDWIQSFPDMNVIVCQNDEMAAGAANALKAANVDMEKFYLLGIDGSANGQQYIRDGLIDATIWTDLNDEISTNLDVAVKVAGGETYKEPVYLNSYKLMTKDNIDELLGSK